MAVTVSLYNHTAKLFANGDVDLAAIKVMLLDATATFTASHTAISSISGDEVSGNGWDVGGELLASAAVTTTTTNDATFDAADLSVNASGGAIGPAIAACIYDDTGNYPLFYVDFGESKTADSGTPFVFTWNASGIVTWTVT
jgi:hypothetical protein